MQERRNPYEAPHASLEQEERIASQEGGAELRHAGFWQRFLALCFDAVLFLPVAAIAYLVGEKTRLFYVYWFVPGLVIGVLFHVYLVQRYGGTPGKLLLKIRIALVDGSAVTTRAASLRYAVPFILSALSSVALLAGTLSMTDDTYFSLGYVARSQKMAALAPPWYSAVKVFFAIWFFCEFVTLLSNRKRRAIHDFIAGTVVIRTEPDA